MNLPAMSLFGTWRCLNACEKSRAFRYVKGLRVGNVVLRYMNRDERPAFVLDDVHDAKFIHIDAQKFAGAPQFILKNVHDISFHQEDGVEGVKLEKIENKEL